jgi:uncharacterized protein (DUF2267 family)
MPYEYLHAGEAFERFLDDARDALDLTTRHQTYTTVQAVLLVFRRRLSVEDGLKFASVLPAVLRAIFVADWDLDRPCLPFSDHAAMVAEVKALRRHHNFSPDNAIQAVAAVLQRHVDPAAFNTVLQEIGPGAQAFWAVVD